MKFDNFQFVLISFIIIDFVYCTQNEHRFYNNQHEPANLRHGSDSGHYQPRSHYHREDRHEATTLSPSVNPYDHRRREEEKHDYDSSYYDHHTTPTPERQNYHNSRNPETQTSYTRTGLFPHPHYVDTYGLSNEHGHKSPKNSLSVPGLGIIFGATGSTAWTGRKYQKYLGIKYGQVGPGLKRFQKAEPISRWDTPYDATQKPHSCPSFPNLNKLKHEERERNIDDCLSISIYSPDVKGRYPVMFYIHGEFFFDGSSEEAQPDYLLEKDIVLVSVEYRLAPFGFMSTLTDDIPGNVAINDVVQALQWVQEHIIYFGGDPRKVTIFGQGAGATMAHTLAISPAVGHDLFHRIILQSGTALNPYLVTTEPLKHTRSIAEKANCPIFEDDPSSVANCFDRLTTTEILKAFLNHCQEKEKHGVKQYGGFQIVVGDLFGYVPRHPVSLVRDGNDYFYPMMGGITKDVGSLYFSQIYPYFEMEKPRSVDDYIDLVLKHTLGEEDHAGLWKNIAIEEFFTLEQLQNKTLSAFAPALIDLIGDILYRGPLLEALQQNAKYEYNGTYLYAFHYSGKRKRFDFDTLPFSAGVSLSDDNIYLFPYPEEVSILDDEDKEIAKVMVDLWTSFATTGVPRSSQVDFWPEMNLVTGPYLAINDDIETYDDFMSEFLISSLLTALSNLYPNIYL